jgi:protein TonB
MKTLARTPPSKYPQLQSMPNFDYRALGIAAALHAAAMAWAWVVLDETAERDVDSKPMMAFIVASPREAPAEKALPPVVRRPEPKRAQGLIATAPDRPSSVEVSSEDVRPREQAAPAAVEQAASAAVTQPRFDADYLNNPKPAYPSMSKRLGEEGQVLLRVLVGQEGGAEQIQVLRSSGFARLDEAAQAAVSRWRFIPAKVGNNATTAWVQVPVTFELRR